MKKALITLCLLITTQLGGQSEQQLARYFKSNPQANANGDGKLTVEEARAHRRTARQNQPARADPTEGDNLTTVTEIPGIDIPESISPVITVPLKSPDGIDLSFAYRTPPGKGPYPAIMFLHGGGGHSTLQQLKNNLLNGTIHTRFLKAGYTIAAATRRPYWKSDDESERIGFMDAVADAVLVVEKAKSLPAFDPDNIVLYGGSGGAMLAIGVASKTDVACAVAGEPATVLLFADLDESKERPDYEAIMKNPKKFYTGKFKKQAQSLFKSIESPILVLHGDIHALKKINFELVIPELESLGKDITYQVFPGLNHGFYWGNTRAGATIHTVEQIMTDVPAYIRKYTTIDPAN